MNRFKTTIGAFAFAAAIVAGGAQSAHAADPPVSDDIELVLQIGENLNIEVDVPSVTITPTLTEIIADTVTSTSAFNLINIRSTADYDVEVSGNGGTAGDGTIANTDIVLNAGDGDVTVPATGSATLLDDEPGPVDGDSFPVDVTINNLQDYPVGTHTTTLTFEITPADGGIPLT